MKSPKKVFSKANLFESVWKEPFHGDDNTVNVHMSNLRNKLSKANPNEEYIETIWEWAIVLNLKVFLRFILSLFYEVSPIIISKGGKHNERIYIKNSSTFKKI